jgi:hypothetical protein
MSRTGLGPSRAAAGGALGGAIAANTMTVVRMAARRRGLVQKTVPQVMEEWLLRRLGVDLPGGPLAHHALDQVLHVGFGSVLGALDGLLFRWQRPSTVPRGLALGVATWAFSGAILMPALRAGKPIWRASAAENALNLGAHLLFGVSNALLTEELLEQTDRGPSSDAERRREPTG